jgi:hypothetical protein
MVLDSLNRAVLEYRAAFSLLVRSRRLRHFSRSRIRKFITPPPPLCSTSRQLEM